MVKEEKLTAGAASSGSTGSKSRDPSDEITVVPERLSFLLVVMAKDYFVHWENSSA